MLEPGPFNSETVSPPSAFERPAAVLKPEPTFLARYGVAAALIVVAFAGRYTLYGGMDNRLPFGFFFLAVIVAAWYGGMGPGLFAAAAGLLLGDYFFLPPHGSVGPIGDAERLAITVYSINSTLVVLVIENLHSRIRKLERRLRNDTTRDADPAASGSRPGTTQ
jgi:K+-sensing histidine kinase KdpD